MQLRIEYIYEEQITLQSFSWMVQTFQW